MGTSELLYADDMVLLASTKRGPQHVLDKLLLTAYSLFFQPPPRCSSADPTPRVGNEIFTDNTAGLTALLAQLFY